MLGVSAISKGTSLILGAILLSAAVIAFTRMFPVSIDVNVGAPSAPAATAPSRKAAGEPRAESKVLYTATTERPLFSATRRPIEKIEPEAVAIAKPTRADRGVFEGRDLVGIIESADGPRLLIDAAGSTETLILTQDSVLGAWQFLRLEGETAIFGAGDETHELTLKERSEGLGAGAVASQRNQKPRRRRGRP